VLSPLPPQYDEISGISRCRLFVKSFLKIPAGDGEVFARGRNAAAPDFTLTILSQVFHKKMPGNIVMIWVKTSFYEPVARKITFIRLFCLPGACLQPVKPALY